LRGLTTAVLLAVFLWSVSYGRDRIIFVYCLSSNESVNVSLKDNLRALRREAKKAGAELMVIEGKREGVFFNGKKTKLFEALEEALKGCSEERCFLIFAGDNPSGVERGFFRADRVYTMLELSSFLSGFLGCGKKLYFIGFDECANGVPFVLRHFSRYARYVAGSPYQEPNWGWQGIYEHFSFLLNDSGENFPLDLLYFYARYNKAQRDRRRNEFFEAGLVCTGLSVLNEKGQLFSIKTCDNGE